MNYKQITAADRKAIEVLLKEKYKPCEIAEKVGFDKSTIYREIKNRATPSGYFAEIAQINYEVRRSKSKKRRKIDYSKTRNYVYQKLQVGWSPEQISGRMRFEGRKDYVCLETIYNFIYTDSLWIEDKMYQYLRRGKKRRTNWKGRGTHKLKIPNRTSIHNRPIIVDERQEIGHYEGDSVLYPNKKVINTLNELLSGRVIYTLIANKTSKNTKEAIKHQLKEEDYAKTLTVDNGLEFVEHEEITEETGVKIYFCDPYSSWQRGSNENANGLLRGYLPKRHNIDELKQEELDDIAEELNNRPRKRLGYKTPNEVYFKHVSILKSVAVESRI